MIPVKVRKLATDEQPPLSLMLTADPSREMIKSYLHRSQIYLAEQEGRVVGVLALLSTRPLTLEIINIAVDEAYQRQGFGRQLIAFAICRARADGYRTLEIGTGNSSLPQLALYQQCGFRIDSVVKNFFLRHYDQTIVENGIRCADMIRLSYRVDIDR